TATAAFSAKAGHCGTFSGQPGQHVIQLRQFNLQLAFAATRMFRKNIQNELRAVNHSPFGELFNIPLLNRRQIGVENNQRGLSRVRFRSDLFELAAADKRGRIGYIAKLKNGSSNVRARAAREFDEFCKRFALRRAGRLSRETRRALPGHTDEQCAFRYRDLLAGFHRAKKLDSVLRTTAAGWGLPLRRSKTLLVAGGAYSTGQRSSQPPPS